ncbi:MAG: hypothetical protein H6Q10_1801 [Acidobacteria bacterium]|nr:hypothetical protein [Acidobacteriota bacterium]
MIPPPVRPPLRPALVLFLGLAAGLAPAPWQPAVAQPAGGAQPPGAARGPAGTPPPPAGLLPRTPLPPATLDLLAQELSGQAAFNNQVKLAGAPWLRDPSELKDTFYESKTLYDLVRSYGIDTVRLERYPGERQVDYPMEGELWVEKPERRLIAKLGADAALVAAGSRTADVSGPLVYVPPLDDAEVKRMAEAGPTGPFKGKWALMWRHPNREAARALDAAGIVGVVSFGAQERYVDPNQVLYSSGPYGQFPNLQLGMTVSWRQWSELLEDLEAGQPITLRGRARIEKFQDRFEAVFAWIPGTEPGAKGVIFTGHLFEGYTKRGANDNMSSPAVQLEILRGLNALIASGQLPRPRRTIYFLWPNEISGTFEFIRRHPGFADELSVNINMDMVGEGLRRNNAVFTMSECPNHLPCYLDGLGESILDYVWRGNDIVYLPDSPRGRPGGQYFPKPMVEKNGSLDAFRYFVHRATGGSDHICFNNPSVAVPGIELFVWPDQWYHSDADTPDKADPTEMKRAAFIGAAAGWVAANLTDEVLPGLLDAVARFGYSRVAARELPRALAAIDGADAAALPARAGAALDLARLACEREIAALRTVQDVWSGSAAARALLDQKVRQWELYAAGLQAQVSGAAKLRAAALGLKGPVAVPADPLEKKYASVVPAIAKGIRGQQFTPTSSERYVAYLKEHPDALKALGVTPAIANTVLNFVNGRRSVAEIRRWVVLETGQDVALPSVAGCLDLLREAGWIE